MVWPHNNDIGKEKPEEPPLNPAVHYWGAPSDIASFHSIVNAEIDAIKKNMQSSQWLLKPKTADPKPKTYANTMQAIDEMMKLQWSHNEIYNKPPDPVLIEGPKGNYAFYDNNPGLPTSIPLKQIRMVLRFDGPNELIKDKLGSSYLLPPKEITESELRRILQEQFKSMEDLIINNLKKAKGIK